MRRAARASHPSCSQTCIDAGAERHVHNEARLPVKRAELVLFHQAGAVSIFPIENPLEASHQGCARGLAGRPDKFGHPAIPRAGEAARLLRTWHHSIQAVFLGGPQPEMQGRELECEHQLIGGLAVNSLPAVTDVTLH